VPSEIRYDHTTQVFRPGTDEPAPAFGDFAGYHGFRLVACVAGRARSKEQTERTFSYVDTSFFATAEAASLAELNHKLRRWLDEVANARTSEDIVVGDGEKLW
jgi:transposase